MSFDFFATWRTRTRHYLLENPDSPRTKKYENSLIRLSPDFFGNKPAKKPARLGQGMHRNHATGSDLVLLLSFS